MLRRLNGRPLRTVSDIVDFSGRVGQEVDLETWREGRSRKVRLRLADARLLYGKRLRRQRAVRLHAARLPLSSGHGAPRDLRRAAALFHQACSAGDVAGCTALARLHLSGEEGLQDRGQAVTLLGQSCAAGDPSACGWLGMLHASGEGVARDEARARELLDKACRAGGADWCLLLGSLDSAACGPAADAATATVDALRRACDGGQIEGCVRLGWMHAVGREVPRDEARGLRMLRQACDGGAQSGCLSLGILMALGLSGRRTSGTGPR